MRINTVTVKFPIRAKGPGAALSGKEAIFEVQVSGVKSRVLPVWDEALAARIREGMTLETLENEVASAVEGEASASNENARNDALAAALLDVIKIDRLPESILEENLQSRFQNMLMEFKEQGSTDAQLEEMSSEENYEKYKKVAMANVVKTVTLSMAFRDIAEKESVTVTKNEITEQFNLLAAQARQKGDPVPEERRALPEIENVLLRKKIFDFLSTTADITWEEASN
eukprot:gene7115-14468_t